MNPSLDLRIRTMIRAVTEIILPGVDKDNALAQEQARLLVGHLHALQQQQPYADRLAAIEGRALKALAHKLINASAGGSVTKAATARVAAAFQTDDRAALSLTVERLIVDSAADGTEAFLQATNALVLKEAKAAANRGRAWFKLMGFDPEPEILPDIPTLISTYEAGEAQG